MSADPQSHAHSASKAPPEVDRIIPRDAANWARSVSKLKLGEVPAEAINLNVTGRRVTSPIQGFGKMWQKTYRMSLEGVGTSPQEVIAVWKERFGEFWPGKNRFYGSLTGIAPGDVALLNLRMPGMTVSTGVLVLYADDESFTVMTPEGHQFSGFNTFSAERVDGTTWVQIQALIRASDPIYEIAMPAIGHRMEDKFWVGTLGNLAAHFGVEGKVELTRVCIDKRRQWAHARNLRHNAAIRSSLYAFGAPFRRRRPKPPA